MKVKKYATSFLLVGLFGPMLMSARAALAAPPINDTIAGATQVPGFPFSDVVDTTEATTDSDDIELNAGCGFPATDASVWYVLNGTGNGVIIDTTGSNYITGILVGVGSPGSLQAVTCGGDPFALAGFFAAAGTTYYVLVVDDQSDGGGNGGALNISFTEVPPPTFDISINPIGQVNTRTGAATISGSYTCDNIYYLPTDDLEVSEKVGRFTILGNGSPGLMCDGVPRSWSADVFPFAGSTKFSGGKLMTSLSVLACNRLFECISPSVQQTVQLRGGGK